MDELEFRRRIYADPETTDSDVVEAAKADESKRSFWNEQKQLDKQFKQALKVEVPDDLASKLIWQQSADEFTRYKRRSRWYVAMAASVAFTIGIGLTMWYHQPLSIGGQALAHMQYAEMEHAHSLLPVDLNMVNAKLASFGGSLSEMLDGIEVANYCHLSTVRSLHLIVNTPQGKMSVFVVPQRGDISVPSEFEDSQYHGESIKMRRANVMVVGDKGADLSEMKKAVSERIQFSA
ncbi:DUF3379 family protein [Alteromonas mediterranea]|jgi:uncharacterized protein DUF3379|uniref:DUF3379 domain-containing protein n=1 Tax=Alteromonas mediterranea TaxID=314275 RepID=A0AAC9F6V5_9ALTE|nr:DUF3379 family protein [Alteromonas mediterranea]MBR9895540.1 DUF3379 domain-containing protein [Gammaproteobacteria bacterium]MDY6883852.1 DUF3379 family protein [Pseudomonadota bacterium]AFV84835.1 hypothetical protein amad1_06620 [Alteromonas mediterranea DE1]AGP96845.1 hypothetical protein I635_06600 [Alteromonas mediterranea UM7]AGQ01196.1 hypothetical protein I636_06700 [Alteromonas mediterranea UM4b]|tara:strand:+ start:5069 stop:5773 length:705 start_codon:yes stop_codon:yes gene_type:complete